VADSQTHANAVPQLLPFGTSANLLHGLVVLNSAMDQLYLIPCDNDNRQDMPSGCELSDVILKPTKNEPSQLF
jgi:hypothetical protein